MEGIVPNFAECILIMVRCSYNEDLAKTDTLRTIVQRKFPSLTKEQQEELMEQLAVPFNATGETIDFDEPLFQNLLMGHTADDTVVALTTKQILQQLFSDEVSDTPLPSKFTYADDLVKTYQTLFEEFAGKKESARNYMSMFRLLFYTHAVWKGVAVGMPIAWNTSDRWALEQLYNSIHEACCKVTPPFCEEDKKSSNDPLVGVKAQLYHEMEERGGFYFDVSKHLDVTHVDHDTKGVELSEMEDIGVDIVVAGGLFVVGGAAAFGQTFVNSDFNNSYRTLWYARAKLSLACIGAVLEDLGTFWKFQCMGNARNSFLPDAIVRITTAIPRSLGVKVGTINDPHATVTYDIKFRDKKRIPFHTSASGTATLTNYIENKRLSVESVVEVRYDQQDSQTSNDEYHNKWNWSPGATVGEKLKRGIWEFKLFEMVILLILITLLSLVPDYSRHLFAERERDPFESEEDNPYDGFLAGGLWMFNMFWLSSSLLATKEVISSFPIAWWSANIHYDKTRPEAEAATYKQITTVSSAWAIIQTVIVLAYAVTTSVDAGSVYGVLPVLFQSIGPAHDLYKLYANKDKLKERQGILQIWADAMYVSKALQLVGVAIAFSQGRSFGVSLLDSLTLRKYYLKGPYRFSKVDTTLLQPLTADSANNVLSDYWNKKSVFMVILRKLGLQGDNDSMGFCVTGGKGTDECTQMMSRTIDAAAIQLLMSKATALGIRRSTTTEVLVEELSVSNESLVKKAQQTLTWFMNLNMNSPVNPFRYIRAKRDGSVQHKIGSTPLNDAESALSRTFSHNLLSAEHFETLGRLVKQGLEQGWDKTEILRRSRAYLLPRILAIEDSMYADADATQNANRRAVAHTAAMLAKNTFQATLSIPESFLNNNSTPIVDETAT